MKRIIFTALLVLSAKLAAFGQAVLPTSYGFATIDNLPTGWTIKSNMGLYTGSGNPMPALKFGATGDYLQIYFASSPSTVKYDIAGNSFNNGTFKVEESVNGTTWTEVTVHNNASGLNNSSGTYDPKTNNLNAASRYVRFFYTTKATGNVGIDNVKIEEAAPTGEQSINVKVGTTTIVNNGAITMAGNTGSSSTETIIIENRGTTTPLAINNIQFSGANASDFSVGTYPATIAANSSINVVVTFTPAQSGSRTALLTIDNDDASNNPFKINVTGYGDGLASEPATQASALVLSNVKTYRITGNFTPSPNAEKHIVLRKKGTTLTEVPVDGVSYRRGDYIGDAQVVFSGNGASFSPNNIIASTGYTFAVFAYNGADANTNYNTNNPAKATATTPATMVNPSLYNAMVPENPTFVDDLHNLINPHTQRYYSDYIAKFIDIFLSRDTVDNQRVITCVYSGENKVYTAPFMFTPNDFSREHTYAHSWMPTYPAESRPEYNDYHHLYPVNQTKANEVRSNYPLGVVVDVFSEYLGSKFGKDANGKYVFEPRDEHKGDAARALFYEAVAYNSVDGKNWKFRPVISTSIPYGQDQGVLKQWNVQDPPSQWEVTRNDFIDSLQANRNPFVDHPEYACFINFSEMTYIENGCTAGIETILNNSFNIFPNPAKDVIYLNVEGTEINGYEVFDIQGRKVKSQDMTSAIGVKVDVSTLTKGSYIVKVNTPYGSAQQTIVIQ